ncbi:MAG: phospholipase D-like domain-containing protein [Deltaproteobacteria bacterium]
MSGFQELLGGAHIVIALLVSAHIVLHKHDVRAAIGWTGLVWLSPIVGSVLYGLFGINRIRRQAGMLRRGRAPADAGTAELALALARHPMLGADAPPSLEAIATAVGRATGLPLTGGNAVDPLVNGDEAYPAMLAAIDAATSRVWLATYIFDRGRAGSQFVDALGRAVARGVAVRVLVDGVGAHYSHPPILRALKARRIRVARFLPPRIPLFQPYFNLRSHRKLLLLDGDVGFCGGMNIRDGYLLAANPPAPTQDVHFRLQGPVVQQLAQAFAFDWAFTTGEALDGGAPPAPAPGGDVAARGVPDGPDEDYETLSLVLLAAVSQARESVRIATPYFLPDPPLVDALRIAALRGVRVDIVLPERGNLRLVQWAATAQLGQVVKWGCRVYLSRPPFDHSKIFVVDGAWSLIGSANWDPRSLRLNFEYDVECYSETLAARLEALLDAKIAGGRRITRADLDGRPLAVRLRDGVARLAQPYL